MRLRLFLSFLLIVLVTSITVVVLSTFRIREDVVQFITRGGLSGSEQLVEDLEHHYAMMGSWENAESMISGAHGPQGSGSGMQGSILADADGRIITGRGRGHMGGFGQGAREDFLTEEEISQAIPLYEGIRVVGYLLPEVRVNAMPGIETPLLQRLTNSAITATVIAVSLSLVLAILLSYALLRPIRDLTEAARSMGRGDLSQRVTPRGNGETALLARTFNEMAESLQLAENRRKALTADIAHELRNPLAIQRANIEALQDGLYPLSLEQLEPLLQQNVLLERLVDDLRTLALADSGHLSLERSPTDLPALIRRRVDELAPEAGQKNIQITLDVPIKAPDALVDPARIGQILTNLMTNALRYAPEHSTISVSLAITALDIRLSVRDQGPGISAQDLPLIFERFYRGDKARSRDQGSTGLGLSIARRLAEAHNGTLSASNHPDGGAVFTLTLPFKSA